MDTGPRDPHGPSDGPGESPFCAEGADAPHSRGPVHAVLPGSNTSCNNSPSVGHRQSVHGSIVGETGPFHRLLSPESVLRQGSSGRHRPTQSRRQANTCKRKAQIGLLASLLGIRFLIPNFKNPFALKRHSTLTPFPTYYIPTVHDFKALVEGRVGGKHCC